MNLGRATEAELDALSSACQPATFGLNQRDVLDETYRKAGKLDTTIFASVQGRGLRVDQRHTQRLAARRRGGHEADHLRALQTQCSARLS